MTGEGFQRRSLQSLGHPFTNTQTLDGIGNGKGMAPSSGESGAR